MDETHRHGIEEIAPGPPPISALQTVTVSQVIAAMLHDQAVHVRTRTRDFRGRVWEIYKSPYGPHLGARVVDDEGRVHHFKVTGDDVRLEVMLDA